MKIAILSNVNMDMLIAGIPKEHEVFKTEGYGQWVSYALEKNEDLLEFNPKLIYLLLDGKAMNDTPHTTAAYAKALSVNYPLSTIAVSDIDDLDVSKEYAWEQELVNLCSANANIIKFPLAELIKSNGREFFYSEKMWYTGSIPYSMKANNLLAEKVSNFSERYARTRKKVLVVDLDNTIWGGVIGEDGPDGIVLSESNVGAAYRDAQKEIKKIGDKGIVLAIASKNNPEDADLAFKKNHHMILTKDDFTTSRINWQPKSQNIKSMAAELNLGLDSFVFLDDNEVEREEVRANAPEVTIVDFPKNIANLPNTIRSIYEQYFWTAKETKEDLTKKEQYKQEALRHQDLETATSIDEYIKSLKIKIEINEVREEQYARTVQLMNKTNQFNTNTLRMDTQEFLEFISKPNNKVYVANVSDKYGDSGLVAIVVGHAENNQFVIDNFLMSCRVMGRKIENSIIRAIEEKHNCLIKASYTKSAKNKPVEKLWDTLGFNMVESAGDSKIYEKKSGSLTDAITEVVWN